ncbi:type II secretion system (T2SS), F family protein [Yersinia ruckeri]|uniref:type II secretion system F family protein n=1 Tax=Yersinia ruckeri TaxID=29486 RepID=UPI0005ABD578|nr:type II secretion system F family protein [Yersinia ruckeri]AJI96246.1 type II secretion system (T2SS), F family protein [Yersinia ruckeri]MCW6567514.1 type II secretion system F family protein [Yersinia ruckeri]
MSILLIVTGLTIFILSLNKWLKIKHSIYNVKERKSQIGIIAKTISLFNKSKKKSEYITYLKYIFHNKKMLHIAVPVGILIAIYRLNDHLSLTHPIIPFVISIIIIFIIQIKLSRKQKKQCFNENFPEVLTIMSMAASSGANLNQILERCGKEIPGELGSEFNLIYRRLNLGEAPEAVFNDAYRKFSYVEFHFFTSVILLNIKQGGQLSDLIKKMHKGITESNKLNQKKAIMTAQIRMTTNIVSLIPIVFTAFLYYMDPSSIEILWSQDIGKKIIIYIIISEILGVFIIRKMISRAI